MRALPARPRCRRLVACAMVASAGVAQASPADNPATDGAVFAGVSGADPANATTNPASLLRLTPGIRLFTYGTLALEQLAIQRRLVDPDDGALRAGPRADDSTFGGGMTAGIMGTPARGAVYAAVSLRPPDETIDDPAVAYHTRGSRSRRIDYVTGAGAYRVTGRIYLGLSATFGQRQQRIAFDRDSALDAGRDPTRGIGSDCGGQPCGFEHPAARERWTIDVGSRDLFDNLNYAVGVLVRLPAGVWLAAAVERPWHTGAIAMSGEAAITLAPRDGGSLLHGEATVIQHLPEVWRVGGRGPVAPGWELVGEVRWRHLGRIDPVDVRVFGGSVTGTELPEWQLRPLGVHDAVAGEVGAEQLDLGQRWRFGGRVGVDTGAVAARRLSARAPWGAQVTASAGAQVRFDRWIVQLGYRVDAQFATSADPNVFDPLARLACIDSDYDYDLPACAATRAGYGTSTAAGTYGRVTHTARVALQFVFP